MTARWETQPLHDVATISYGYTESASERPIGPKFLRITDIQDDGVDWDSVPYCRIVREDAKKYRLASGDIVFARTGATTGKSFLVQDPPDAVFASYLIRLRVRNGNLLPKFVSLFFQTDQYWKAVQEGSTGSAQGGFNATKLGELTIPIPPLAEQRRITAILDKAFAAIATAKANTEKNLQNARHVYERYLESAFTERSDGWKEKPLGTLAEFRNGINYTKASRGERVKVVGVKDFQKNFWIPSEGLDTVTIDGKLDDSDLLRKGDILTVRSNGNIELIGRCMLAGKPPGRVSHSGFTIRIRLAGEDVLPEYLCHFLKCSDSRNRLVAAGIGTNIKSLNQQTLSALKIPFSSIPKQKAIVARLERMSGEAERLESVYNQKLGALDELKKSLLHEAFNGRL